MAFFIIHLTISQTILNISFRMEIIKEKKQVILSIKEYEALISRIEDLEDIITVQEVEADLDKAFGEGIPFDEYKKMT